MPVSVKKKNESLTIPIWTVPGLIPPVRLGFYPMNLTNVSGKV